MTEVSNITGTVERVRMTVCDRLDDDLIRVTDGVLKRIRTFGDTVRLIERHTEE